MRLIVRDTGQGIPAEFLPYVFDRFRQADAVASRRHGGLGLGLALVRQIVELHGGAVGVESGGCQAGLHLLGQPADIAGGGTILSLREVRAAGDAGWHLRARRGRRRRCARDADRTAEAYGAATRGASSSAEALADLSGGAAEIDVLVSDLGMPHTDGYALIRQVRALPVPEARSVPAIAVTAYANPDDRVRALVAGYQTHIAKPVDAALLAASIAGLVKGRNGPRSA